MIAVDSEFQSLIPPLDKDEFERLEKSITNEGFHEWEPIVTWNGTIIDGHNRYRICEEHGIRPTQVEREFDSRDAAKIWIIEHQFGRRNLKPYDRSVLALELEPLYAAEARRRQSCGQGGVLLLQNSAKAKPLHTDERLAKVAGVSRDTIRKVKVIENEAAKGNQTAVEAREAVKSGKKSIHKAFVEVRPKGDKADKRPICTICGKPIDEGDSYGHDRNKHRSCASDNTEIHRGKRGGRPSHVKFTDDGRRICTICGKPIDEGDSFDHHPSVHKDCFRVRMVGVHRRWRERKRLEQNITIGDVNEVIEHDKAELKRSLMLDVNSAWSNLQATLSRYEGMGVAVTEEEANRIRDAIEPIVEAIQSIEE